MAAVEAVNVTRRRQSSFADAARLRMPGLVLLVGFFLAWHFPAREDVEG